MESLTTTISGQVDRKQLTNKGDIPFNVVNPKPSKELLEALQEGEDILNGKANAKKYHSIKELIGDLDNKR
mgnify:CR=1 FL=1